MANFSTVSRVQQTIRAGDEVEFTRGGNRVKINNNANCAPMLDPAEAKELGIKINVNWGELMILLSHARRQYMTAFWGQQNFFNVKLPYAPAEHQAEWGQVISSEINRPMKRSLAFFELHRSKWSAVACHGIGPICWYKPDHWLPKYLAIEDLRIPTDTTLDFENLGWYGARHTYTPFELLDTAFNSRRNNRWDKPAIASILKTYKEINYDYAPNHYDWETTPEKLAELVKQDGGWYASDAMPGIPLWHFYYLDNTAADEEDRGWFMKIVPESGTVRGTPENDHFLWESKNKVANSWQELIHCQYGDLSNKAPFMFHSIRSLGLALMEPTFYDNLTKCRLLQHMHDNFDVWLRLNDPADKARANMQEFGNYKVLRTGVQVVPQAERHQIDPNLVEMGLAQMQQLKQEASASYTQQPDTGTKREQTAFETSIKMQQVNAMMGGLLLTAFIYETQAYREICRRFCLKKTTDLDILQFQKRLDKAGIPRQWWDVDLWDVEPVTPLGMGNPAMAQAEAQQLMNARGAFEPEAQQEILHDFVLVTTSDSRKAARWAPIGKKKDMTQGMIWVVGLFGTLMQGIQLQPRQGISPIEQLDALIPMFAAVVSRIAKRAQGGQQITMDELAGIQAVQQYSAQLLQMLATDEQQKQRVKQYGDALGKIMNEVKALVQRAQAQAKAAAKQNGAADGKGQEQQLKMMLDLMEAKQKGKIEADKHQRSEARRQREFTAEQRRKDADTFNQIQRDNLVAKNKTQHDDE